MPWNIPEDIGYNDPRLCQIEGCEGKGPCHRCGEVNYRLMGYWGSVARWSKKWGLTEKETMRRMENNQRAKEGMPTVEEELVEMGLL